MATGGASETGAMQYRRDIDGLRAVAVLPVVLCHAGVAGFGGGFIGVDVFFVISGFLITTIVVREIAEQRFSLTSFYARRARRILPALAAVLVACLAIGWFVLIPMELQRLGRATLAAAAFASNFHFARSSGYFGPAAEFEPLLHTWSLAVEEQFYLAFPPLLMAMAALRWSRHLLAAMAAVSAVSLAASAALLDSERTYVFYLSMFRAWELGVGAMLAMVAHPAPTNRVLRETIGLGGLLAILVPVFIYSDKTPFPATAALPPVIGAAALIWIGRDDQRGIVTRLLAQPAPVAIGLVSYSLYLWHWPILAYLRLLEKDPNLTPPVIAGALTASLGMAWLSYRFVEQPFRAGARSGVGNGKVLLLSAAVIAVLGLTGEAVNDARGVPSRLEQHTLRIANTTRDRNRDAGDCLGRLPTEDPCPLGESASGADRADFVLLGDSHAEMLRSGVNAAAEQAGQRGYFIGKIFCVPMPDIERAPSKVDCRDFNAALWSWLGERRDIELVIIAVRWTIFVEGRGIGAERDKTFHWRWIGPEAGRPASPSSAAYMEAAVTAMVDRLVADGRRVLLIGPVPEPGFHVPIVTARRRMLGLAPRADRSQADLAARAGRTERLLQRIAARSPSVRYLPLGDVFCQQGPCRSRNPDGIPLYFDDDHVTRTTAETLLRPRLEAIWGGKAP
jgi:peptidoglycan/LPS O-acetylase OafA/YrhL